MNNLITITAVTVCASAIKLEDPKADKGISHAEKDSFKGKPSPYAKGQNLLPPPVNPELSPAPETETSSVIAAQSAFSFYDLFSRPERPNTLKIFTSKIVSATKDNSDAKNLCAKNSCPDYTGSDGGLNFCHGDNGSGDVYWDFYKIENTDAYYIRNTQFLGENCAYTYLRTEHVDDKNSDWVDRGGDYPYQSDTDGRNRWVLQKHGTESGKYLLRNVRKDSRTAYKYLRKYNSKWVDTWYEDNSDEMYWTLPGLQEYYAPKEITKLVGTWQLQASSNSDLKRTITEGISKTDGTSVEKGSEHSWSVAVGVEVGFKAGAGAKATTTVTAGGAYSESRETSTQLEKFSNVANEVLCNGNSPTNFLYQYVRTGMTEGESDSIEMQTNHSWCSGTSTPP